jgi:hypothetical protein
MEAESGTARRRIITYLDQTLLAVLSVRDGLRIHQRLIQFGNDTSGTVYLRIRAGSSLADLVRRAPLVSLLVFREAPLLEDICSLAIEGRASLLPETATAESNAAFAALGRKSPLLGDIPFSAKTEHWRIIRIDPEQITMQGYRAWLDGTPPLILTRSSKALDAETSGQTRNTR